MSHYKDVLFSGSQQTAQMSLIRSNLHQVYTQYIIKTSLSAFDDKRWLINATDSYAYGHYKIVMDQ